jgi:hypothetical protein
MSEPTLRQRANAALREAAQVRRGNWKGDPAFKRYGETLLDRYEALAQAAKAHTEPEREGFYG